jgi:hypothetical protein
LLIYKYRSGTTRDIEALMNNQFYASNMETLNDVHEGKIKINDLEIDVFDYFARTKIDDEDSSIKNILENFRNQCKNFGIYSLCKENYSNELLWAYYANSHKGFCIEYDFDILKQYPFNEDSFFDVEYSENIPIVNLNDLLNSSVSSNLSKKLLATKSSSWKHEYEIRIITPSKGEFNYFIRALKSIYFGYRITENTKKFVMNILRGRGIKYYQMTHKKDLYELEKIEIEDIFKDESIYNNKVNKFVPYFSEDEKPYEDLIKKAIIIVEQEPLCEEVTYASKSSNRGTIDNPVFFISYINKIKNLPTPNYFISKKEIEEIFKN